MRCHMLAALLGVALGVCMLSLQGCDLEEFLADVDCKEVVFPSGRIPAARVGENAPVFCAEEGFVYMGPMLQCIWVQKRCFRSTTGKDKCEKVHRFGADGHGLETYPSSAKPLATGRDMPLSPISSIEMPGLDGIPRAVDPATIVCEPEDLAKNQTVTEVTNITRTQMLFARSPSLYLDADNGFLAGCLTALAVSGFVLGALALTVRRLVPSGSSARDDREETGWESDSGTEPLHSLEASAALE
eukprot:gnl/TRDRNA2_/TRDRNA2_195123_c0_seq1.p1 gnl/TRDRNA2_/TRDRNA2_195123_c0~~gnl/TRDRNA2_/TRDRNA2_195123_c0_seq1.p1  ORF type:complete len:244 (+),score=38.03 gnl/TRDRNA2_/TRDRNA2_195123_c0_seq1:79-810(+)